MFAWLWKWWRADRAYFRGCRLAREGKWGEAVRAFDQVIAHWPADARAHGRRALALAGAGRHQEAVRAARKAAELAPDNHAPLLFLGQIHFDAGNLTEARKALVAARRLDPDNRLVQAWLGLCLLALGDRGEGVELLDRHLDYGYEGVEGRLIALVEARLWGKEGAPSLEEQLRKEEGEEERGGFWLRVFSLVRRAGLWPLARVRGRAAAELLLAEEAFALGEAEEAVRRLRAAEGLGAGGPGLALRLGQAYYESGRPQAAVEQFSRVPEEERRAPEVALLVGGALFEAGRYEEARPYLTIAADRYRRDFAPAYYRGLCDIALGNRRGATKWFIETAARLNPRVARRRLQAMLEAEEAG